MTIRRAAGTLSFPADFILISAMNPCPCGYRGDPTKECRCSSSAIDRYQKRLSGPLLDRIDIHVEAPRVEYEKLSASTTGERSGAIRERVEAARSVQRRRFGEGSTVQNGTMGLGDIRRHCPLDDASAGLVRSAMRQLNLSARAYHRVLKLGRTIADLADSEDIRPAHIAEAIQYRRRETN
ncbi:MAG: ATP-binding protein [Chloroflexia bacterium]